MRRTVSLVVVSLMLVLPRAASARTSLEGIPDFDHIAIITLENENAASTWSGATAKYLKSLMPQGVFAEQYYATSHLSLGNYIALVSAQPGGPHSDADCEGMSLWLCVQPQGLYSGGRNLADQLEEKGLTWKGYMDSMPSPCFHATYDPTDPSSDPYQGDSQTPPAKDYADRHNPFIYFPNIIENSTRCKAHVVPYLDPATGDGIARDLANDTFPNFAFISPDTCHDGHDSPCSNGQPGGLRAFDTWLKAELPPLLDYMNAHRGLVIITADEDGFSTTRPFGCCSGGPTGFLPGYGGRIGLLALSPLITPGRTVTTEYDHMSLVRTIEDAFGIGEYLNNAAQAKAMADVLS